MPVTSISTRFVPSFSFVSSLLMIGGIDSTWPLASRSTGYRLRPANSSAYAMPLGCSSRICRPDIWRPGMPSGTNGSLSGSSVV